MFKNKKSIILITSLLIGTILLTSCSTEEKKSVKNEDINKLVVAQDRDATSLDPHGSNDEGSSRIKVQIFNNLVKYTEDRELVGDLAESWEQKNPETWIFKIREGVKFHDDSDLTSEDIKFSLERSMKTPLVSHILEEVESVNILDDDRIEIKTYEPNAPLMANLANPVAAIMSKNAIENSGEEVGQEPIGTGPFKFKKWKSGDSILLEKNEDYFGEKAKVDEVEFVIIPEGNNRGISLETEEIDIAYEIDPVNISQIKEDQNLEYIVDDSFTVHYLGFNTKKKPFDDVRVRQAIAYAIDIDEILETVLYGTVKKADSLLNDNVIGSGGEYENYEYNSEKAKKLLKEAGFEDGLDFTMWISDSDIRERISEVVQGQLKNIGINMSIEMLEWGAFVESVGQGRHDAYMLAATVSTGDADDPLSLLLHSDQMGDAGNRAFYENKKVDKLIEYGRKEINPEKRIEIYTELQNIVNKEIPLYPLYFNNQNAGINKKVKGFKLNPAGYHYLQNVYIEE